MTTRTDEIIDDVVRIIKDLTQVDLANRLDTVLITEFDRLTILGILIEIDDKFDVSLDYDQVYEMTTVRHLEGLILHAL